MDHFDAAVNNLKFDPQFRAWFEQNCPGAEQMQRLCLLAELDVLAASHFFEADREALIEGLSIDAISEALIRSTVEETAFYRRCLEGV